MSAALQKSNCTESYHRKKTALIRSLARVAGTIIWLSVSPGCGGWSGRRVGMLLVTTPTVATF